MKSQGIDNIIFLSKNSTSKLIESNIYITDNVQTLMIIK